MTLRSFITAASTDMAKCPQAGEKCEKIVILTSSPGDVGKISERLLCLVPSEVGVMPAILIIDSKLHLKTIRSAWLMRIIDFYSVPFCVVDHSITP